LITNFETGAVFGGHIIILFKGLSNCAISDHIGTEFEVPR